MSTSDSWGWPWRKANGIGERPGFTADPGSPKGSEASQAIETRSALSLTTARSGSFDEGDAGRLLQKQSDFERQMQTADQKQSELFHFQWNLIRDQMGGFTREMSIAKRDLDSTRLVCSRVESLQATSAKENARIVEVLEQQKAQRDTSHAELQGQLSSLRSELSTANEDQARLHLALQRLDNQLSPQLGELQTRMQADAQERAALRDLVPERCEDRLSELRGLLEHDRVARQASEAEARSASEALARELRERFGSLSAELRDVQASAEQLQKELRAEVEQRKCELSVGLGEQQEAQAMLGVRLQEQSRHLDEHVSQELARQREARDSLEAKLRAELSEVSDTHDAGIAAMRCELSHERLHSVLEGFEARMRIQVAETCQNLEMQNSSLSERLALEVQSREGASSALHSASVTGTAALEAMEMRLREEIAALSDGHHTARKGLHAVLLDLNAETRKELEDHRAVTQEQLGRSQDEHQARFVASLEAAEAKLRAEMTRANSENERHRVELRERLDDVKSRSQDLQASERVQVIASVEATELKLRADMSCLSEDLRATTAEQRGMISKHELATHARLAEVQDQLMRAKSLQAESLQALDSRSRSDLSREASGWQSGHEALQSLAVEQRTVAEQSRSSLLGMLQQERLNIASLADRLDDFERKFKDNVAQIHVNQEASTMELQGLVEQSEKRALFREDFDKESKRIWEAIDSHSHEVAPMRAPAAQVRPETLGVPVVQVTSPQGRGGKQPGKLDTPTGTPTGSVVFSSVPAALERHRLARSPAPLGSRLSHGSHPGGFAGSVRLPTSPTGCSHSVPLGQSQRSVSASVLPGGSGSMSPPKFGSHSVPLTSMTPPAGSPPKFSSLGGSHSMPLTFSGTRRAEPEKVTCGPARYSAYDARSAT